MGVALRKPWVPTDPGGFCKVAWNADDRQVTHTVERRVTAADRKANDCARGWLIVAVSNVNSVSR